MSDISIILKYFPDLTDIQKEQFRSLEPAYKYWNERINVISRKDIDQLYIHHVLHSLAIAKFISLPPKSRILDVGTGGGFPGIPLSIIFPQAEFTLVDSIGKKIKVVQEVSASAGIKNINAIHSRAEQLNQKFDFVVSRAVTEMPKFVAWVRKLIATNSKINMGSSIIALKGGDLENELGRYGKKAEIVALSSYFEEDFFETKKIVYLPI